MASSSSSRTWNYDVFLSFRGEDTRKTVLSHLYKAFVTRGISTFKDDRKLEMGDCISDTLCRAIRTSRFAAVVISQNYATSRWCLEELRLIMELEAKKEIEVVPIFYGVNPSDVRHQRGSFALDLMYQGSEMADKVLRWREALTRIANRKGKDSTQCEDEAVMIEDIVRRISTRLLSMLPIDLGYVVGMEAHMEGLKPLLDMDSKNDDVRMIGIWGMGGIGKTTIAKYLYEQLKLRFSPHHYFMENIWKVSSKHGLMYLQEQLLSNILGEGHLKLWSLEQGAHSIKSRLGNLAALIVFDDVDDESQLYALAKEARWFGPGSRIIITTRDKSLLNSCGVRTVYDVKCLDNDNALKLFHQIAFEGEHPPPSRVYRDLSNRISRLAQGLPLALEAFGFNLRGKSLREWQTALKLFKEAPYENLMSILKHSYDSLDELSKATFLHVACLFNGEPVWRIMTLLDHGEVGMRVLAEKSLIDISTDGYIAMHVLVEKMGRKIVRHESGNRPSEQRILWHPDDIYPVFADNAGTSKSEGLALDISVMTPSFEIDWNLFKPMHNLNFLKIYKHSEGLDSKRSRNNVKKDLLVPRKLRLLLWDAYPFTTLPSTIHLESLVELNMCHSKLRTLWSGTPRLLHLRRLYLTGSKDLKELPDLQEATFLEELRLEGCISLKRIPKSVSSLSRLQKLDVSNCDRLINLRILIRESEPSVLEDRSSGRYLHARLVCVHFLDAEPYVKEFQGGIFPRNLSIKGNLDIKLELLEGYAEHLCFISKQHIPHEPMMLEKQTPISASYSFISLDIMRFKCSGKIDPFKCFSFSDFPWLMELNLINLNIEEIPDDIHHMRVLEKLDLSGNGFRVLPTTLIFLINLKHLILCNCHGLEALPELYQLETLTLSDCTSLRALVNLSHAEQGQGRFCLVELWLDNCKNVESMSDQLSRFKNLTYLDISRHDFETVPRSIKDLSSLVTLCLNYCNNLKSLTELPLSLKYLYAHGCKSLETSSVTIANFVDHCDLSPCLCGKKDSTRISRFPAGRRSEEVPLCACFLETKMMNSNNQLTRSPISILLERLLTYVCPFVFYIMITMGSEAIYSRPLTWAYIFLSTLFCVCSFFLRFFETRG